MSTPIQSNTDALLADIILIKAQILDMASISWLFAKGEIPVHSAFNAPTHTAFWFANSALFMQSTGSACECVPHVAETKEIVQHMQSALSICAILINVNQHMNAYFQVWLIMVILYS